MNNARSARGELRDLIELALFGALMLVSDQLMNFLPNVHLIAMFVILLTRFYRVKALLAIAVFVVTDGLIEGFYISTWISYSYIWALLWAVVMLLPKTVSNKKGYFIYPIIGGAHGLLFGILTSPPSFFMTFPSAQWSIKNYFSYIAAGFSFDLIHMAGNIAACMLVVPLLSFMNEMRRKKLL